MNNDPLTVNDYLFAAQLDVYQNVLQQRQEYHWHDAWRHALAQYAVGDTPRATFEATDTAHARELGASVAPDSER